MIELRTLGTFAVRDPSNGAGDLPLAPRQAAVLTYLALARPRGRIARDRLLGVFWPDQPDERGRAALRQALYRLRVELGRDIVATSGDVDVELRWDELKCDVMAFDDALDRSEFEAALDLFGGELLAGFHLAATPEFEHWLDAERTRLRQRAVDAAATLAQRDEEAGNPAGAANWLRRALTWSPYDEALLRNLARCLTAAGDRSGAIREYEVFAARLNKDLELEPSLSLRDAIASLRTAQPAGEVVLVAIPRRIAQVVEADLVEGVGAAAPLGSAVPASGPTSRPIGQSARFIRRIALSVAAATVLGAAVLQGFGVSLRVPGTSGPSSASRTIVIPFENQTGDPALEPLGRMTADWLTQSLQRTGLVEVIDATATLKLQFDAGLTRGGDSGIAQRRQMAEAARASTIVWGSIFRQNGQLSLHAHVTAAVGTVLRTVDPVVTSENDIGSALETLRGRVAGALATVLDERLAGIVAPSSPPPTFEAYQEFAEGMDRLFSSGHAFSEGSEQAIAHFERAAQLDSTFIQARFWAARVLDNFARFARADSIVLSLLPMRDRLPRADRAALDFMAAGIRDDHATSLIAARRAAQLAPQSIWWHTAASKALDLGRPREALEDLAVFGPDGGWLKDWPAYWGARLTALHNLGEYREQLALARSAPGLPSPDRRPAWGPPLFDMHQLYALAALGRLDELDQLTDSLVNDFLGRGWSRNVSDTYHWVGRELRAHGFADHARKYFERCIAHIPKFREYRFECMLEAGQYEEVYAYFLTQMDRPPNHARDTWAAVAAARLGHRDKAEWHLTRVLQAWPAKRDTRTHRAFTQARIAALLGEKQRAVDILRQEPYRGALFYDMHTSSDFDGIRDDPFIAALLRFPK